MNKYNFDNRIRIEETRDFENGIFLNRAERTEPWSEEIIYNLKKNLDFNKIGYYYDLNDFHIKYSNYINIQKEQLLMTNGADEAIRFIFNTFANKNDNIMFPEPTYGMYNVYTNMYKCNAIILTYNENFKIDKKKLYQNLNKVKIFFLPNPNHTEDNFMENEISNICEILTKNEGIIVVDETYYGFGSPTMINLLDKYNNLYIIRSFSKTCGLPSIRLGCLLSNKNINISNLRGGYEVSYFTFKIAEYFLDNIYIINNYIDECIKGRKYLINYLEDNNIKYNGNTGYIFNIVLNNIEQTKVVHSKLWKEKIYTRIYKNTISITICPIKYIEKFLYEFKMC
tara:strand:- start:26 stop:1045 length:1020 start_codon:yes stop_codon:yes gene_type:complete